MSFLPSVEMTFPILVVKFHKGYLLGMGWDLKRTHDLEVLLNEAMARDDRFQRYLHTCIFVREFYVEERYPFIGSPSPARSEFQTAVDAIQEMVALILKETGLKG
jgi:HEPN domain-containing protein